MNINQFEADEQLEADEQHQELISLLDGVKFAIEAHHSENDLNHLITTLQNLFITHFSAEERLYESHSYPESSAHKQDHSEILNKISLLKKSLTEQSWNLALEATDVIKYSFLSHVTNFDDRFAPELDL